MLYICSVQLLSPTNLQSLRAKLEKNFPAHASTHEHADYIPTGIDGLDRLLGGGLNRGGVNAWTGRLGAGALSLLRATVDYSLNYGRRVAVVDGTARFVPSEWVASSNASNLWMVRLQDVVKAFTVAEILSKCGGFDLIVVDVGALNAPTRVQHAHLRRASKEGGGALLITGESVGLLGAKVVAIEPVSIDLRTLERTLRLSLVKGGNPRSLEVVLDVSGQFIPCRMPSYSALPDRRPRAKRRHP